MRKLASVLVLLLVVGTSSATARDLHRTVDVGGTVRSYDVHLPPGRKDAPAPLLIVLHGALGDASTAKIDTGMSKRADRHGFITVYPQGTPMLAGGFRTWNAGSCCGSAAKLQVDDVGFVRAVIEQVERDYDIDSNRIYVCGLSNGGMLAYRLAAEMSEMVAAAGSVEGALVSEPVGAKGPVSIIAFHSTRDKVLPYSGGTGSLFGYKVNCLSVSEAVRFWVKEDGCSDKPAITREDGLIKERYAGGKDGTEVCLYTSKFGHSWPVLRTWLAPLERKRAPADIVCEFFEQHPKQHVGN